MPGMRSDGSIIIDTRLDNTGFTKGSERLKQAVKAAIEKITAEGSKLKAVFKGVLSVITTSFKAGAVTALTAVSTAATGVSIGALDAARSLKQLAGNAILKGFQKIGGVLKTVAGGLVSLAKGLFSTAIGFIKSAVTEGVADLAKTNATFNAAMSQLMTSFYALKGSIVAAFAPLITYAAPIISKIMNMVSEAISRVGMLIAALTGKEYVKAVPVQQDYADSLQTTAEKEKEARKALQDQKKAMDKDRKAAKKLNKELDKTISSFDDINILNDNRNDDDDDDFDFDTDIDIPETPKVEYTTEPISSEMLDLANKLKDMFKNADFTALGRMLGEKLRDALNNIPWDKIKEAARNIAKSIATLLNGFLETPGLFEAIGRTLAEGLNTAFEFLNLFAQNFHFASLGSAVGKAINSALQTIDWPLIYETFRNWGEGLANAINAFLLETDFTLIGETLGRAFNSIYYGVYEFVSTLDWPMLGQKIKDAILGLANSIDWPGVYSTYEELGKGIGEALQNAINDPAVWTAISEFLSNEIRTLLLLLNEFVKAIDWAELGVNIGTGMNNAIESFDWNLLAETLINVINAAFDLWYNWVTTFDFMKFGTHIGETLAKVVNEIDWEEGGAAVGTTIQGLFDAMTGFVNGMDWGSLGAAAIDVIAGFFGEFDWASVSALLSACISGLLDFLSGAVEEVNWLDVPTYITNEVGEFLSGFDWGDIASSAMELLGAALAAAIQLVGGLGSALFNWIADGLESMWDYFGTEIDECGGNVALGILKGIADVFIDIGKWLKENIWDPFVEGLKSVFGISSPAQTMLEYGGYIIEGILQGIINGLASIVDWLKEHVFDPIVDGIKTLFGLGDGDSTTFLEFGGQIISGLLNGIINGLSDIAGWIETNVFTPIVDGIKTLFGLGDGDSTTFLEFGGQLISGLLNGIINGLSDIAGWIETNVFTPITDGIKSLFGLGDGEGSSIFSGFGGQLISGLLGGITDGLKDIANWISTNVFTPITDGIKSLFGLGEGDSDSTIFSGFGGKLIGGLLGGITDGLKDIANWISKNIFTPITDGIKSLFGLGNGEGDSTIFSGFGGKLIGGLLSGISDGLKDISNWIGKNVFTPITDGFKTLFEIGTDGISSIFSGFGGNLISGLKDGLSSAVSGVKDWLGTNITGPITSGFKSLFGIGTEGGSSIFSGFGGNMIDGLKDGLTDAAANAGSWIESNVTGPITGFFKDLFGVHSPSTVFDGYGGDLMAGLEQGIEGSTDLPKNALSAVQGSMKDVFGAAKELLEWASLGSKIMEIGLVAGIISQTTAANNAVGTLESGMRDKVTENIELWKTAGTDIANAFSWHIQNGANWWDLGVNIIQGIYNGVLYNSGALNALAWNTAAEMYTSACRALGIASPSKKFYWIAEMMTKGMVNGLENTKDSATGAVATLADSMVDTAEDANPIISISTEMGEFVTGFGDVLTTFSDKVTDSFANMISAMERIAAGSAFTVPAVAEGTAVPYAVNAAAASSSRSSDVDEMMRVITAQSGDRLTRNDLVEVLTAVCRQYMNFNFYISDEQIARHNNAGQLRLQRRGVL